MHPFIRLCDKARCMPDSHAARVTVEEAVGWIWLRLCRYHHSRDYTIDGVREIIVSWRQEQATAEKGKAMTIRF